MPDAPYIQKLTVKNFGCIRDAEFPLTRLHAFVGPNDSGKSTILRATAEVLSRPASRTPRRPDEQEYTLRAVYDNQASISLRAEFAGDDSHQRIERAATDWLTEKAPRTMLMRLDPDQLRMASQLIPDGTPLRFLSDRGAGLAAVYDAIFSRQPRQFFALSDGLIHLFPTVKSLGWANVDSQTKQMQIQLYSGAYVRADLMSEGMLYYLAFAAIPYLDDLDVLLLEEPENGLHPSRIVEVMQILRRLSTRTQVLIATHSPLVINELEPDEVTVVTRDPEVGTRGVLMKDTADFERRSKVYALGELWLSYANGVDEKPLVDGGPRP